MLDEKELNQKHVKRKGANKTKFNIIKKTGKTFPDSQSL